MLFVRRIAALSALAALALGGVAGFAPTGAGATVAPIYADSINDTPIHPIWFPVEGKVSYSNDFDGVRGGDTRHDATDIMAGKLQHIVAPASGTVTRMKIADGGTGGNQLSLTGDDGWKYFFAHINNDTPGTDDGLNPPEWRFAPDITVGMHVAAGRFLAYVGDSGNAEDTGSHAHFEMTTPDGKIANPYVSLRLSQGLAAGNRCRFPSNPTAHPSASSGRGYWVLGSDGGVFTYGSLGFYGSTGGMKLNSPVVGMAATPTGNGYWLVASDGGIFSFGDAKFSGSTGALKLKSPILGMASTPTGNGYWLVAGDGGIFSFGDAAFYGSTGAMVLNKPVVGMSRTPSGHGYWLVASDGGIFSFGDATFFGSTGALRLDQPVIGMATRPQGDGYWLVGMDGGVFTFAAAPYVGSTPAEGFCVAPTAAQIVPSATGAGYWIQGTGGLVTGYGDARQLGDPHTLGVKAIGIAAVQ
ncbi:MAG: Esterase [Actinomycetia bacterium]|nr:Esterase [Actinomycetes bacterium]